MLIRPLILLALIAASGQAKDFPIATLDELDSALAVTQPGDNLVLREGEWRDAQIVFIGQGTPSAPITLRSTTPGKTVFTGASRLRIGGEHLIVDGLHFQDPDPTVSDLIEFRKDSKLLAKNCRMTNCAVISSKPAEIDTESRWLGLYGEGHRVDRSTFTGKSGKGATFVVWLGDKNLGNHRIDHNYFGPREKLGRNGGETIRIGDSKTSMLPANCVVENNLFERCNGEAECISNKSCGNIYRENAFLEVSGTLTLRHGNACLVERNTFLGGGAGGTGGIRVIGEDHVVRGNYLERLTGDDARSAITLMMGIPNSPENRYFQVQRARIEHNVIVDCEHSILIGLSDDKLASLAPVDTLFIGNHVSCPKYAVIEARCDLEGIEWSENRCLGKSPGIASVPTGIDFAPGALSDSEIKSKRLEPISRSEVGTLW